MNSQILRICIAGGLSAMCLAGVLLLAVVHEPIPDLLGFMTVASTTYLFGVVTNGSGLKGKAPPE